MKIQRIISIILLCLPLTAQTALSGGAGGGGPPPLAEVMMSSDMPLSIVVLKGDELFVATNAELQRELQLTSENAPDGLRMSADDLQTVKGSFVAGDVINVVNCSSEMRAYQIMSFPVEGHVVLRDMIED